MQAKKRVAAALADDDAQDVLVHLLHHSVQLPFLGENFAPLLAHFWGFERFEWVQDRRHSLHFIAVGAAVLLSVLSDDLSNFLSSEVWQIFLNQCQVV